MRYSLFVPAGFALAALAVSLPTAAMQDTEAKERAAVIRTVERFFDAMHGRDRATLESLALPEGQGFAVRDGAEEARPQGRSLQALIDSLVAGERQILERMWSPEVRLDLLDATGIATLWAPYDFWIEGERHHCGVDAFQLLKTAEGWRIAGIVWTSRETDCPESPLPDPQ